MATSWPPTLDALKAEMQIEFTDDASDEALTLALDAAVAFVQRVRSDLNFTTTGTGQPTAEHYLGTLRLAARWFTRRRSPDALIQMGELGAARVPSFDPDIERLLGIGRYRGPVFA